MTERATAPFRIWAGGEYELAEGTRWLGDRLVFTDLLAGTLLAAPAMRPGQARVLARLGVPLGAVAPVAGQPGEWIAAAGPGIALIGADGTLTRIARPEDRAPAAMRMNDGCCGPGGRFWAGSMSCDTADASGRLWVALWDGSAVRRYRPDGSADAVIPVPARRPASVCLGGRGGGQVFISTARYGIPDPSPEDGAILSGLTGARAPRAASFIRRFP